MTKEISLNYKDVNIILMEGTSVSYITILLYIYLFLFWDEDTVNRHETLSR